MTSQDHISTCEIACMVALNKPISPFSFNRSEESKSSLVKNYDFWDMTLFEFMTYI